MSIALSFLDRPTYGLSDDELMTRLDDIITLERHLAAARLSTINELCARGIPARRGYAHPSSFLRDHLKLTTAAAGQTYRLAKVLPNRPETADALAKGAISEAQAAVITRTITDITPYASEDERAQAADMLVSHATVLPPKELTLCGNRILHYIAPEAAEERDRKAIEKMERSAWESRAFSVTDDGHGRYRFRGTTTAEGAALLHTILDPLTHPRRTTAAKPTPETSAGKVTGPPGQSTDPAAGTQATNPADARLDRTTSEPASGPISQAASSPISGPFPEPTAESVSGPADEPTARPVSGPAGEPTAESVSGLFFDPYTDPASNPIPDPCTEPASNPIPDPSTGPASSSISDPYTDPASNPSTQPTISGPGNPNAFKETRTATQRRHDALLDVCRLLLAAGQLPENGGSKPQIVITTRYDTLTQQLTAGTFNTGAPLSAETIRRMSCDAGILPAVLDGQGVPLDLGRERRLISGSLRKALNLRDKGCSFPGCDRPPRWCQGHHTIPWSEGGKTALASSVLLCGFHHTRIHHEDGWTVHIGTDGHAWFTPPAWLDPQQTPRRNLYHTWV